MGFWSDVAYDVQRGIPKEDAIRLNAIIRDNFSSKKEIKKAEAELEALVKLNNKP